MATSLGSLRSDELSIVGADTQDPSLHALEVAIYVEESLDVVLPDPMLDDACLGSPESVQGTVAALYGGH